MFATLSRSWGYARMSYGLVWNNKRLMLFPMISSVAALLVTASFALPLWQAGVLAEWSHLMEADSAVRGNAAIYITAFLFYFCNYFVIVFFNTGLIACALAIINGERASVSYGLSFAVRRLPQIFGWALFSAVIGVALKAIEKSNKKAGAIVAAILGSAWTALTYFVIPVIVLDGVGPIEAFKRSVRALKSTWGTALVGNFTLGFFAFLVMLPLILVLVVLFGVAAAGGSVVGMVAVGVLAVPLIVLAAAATSAADMIFKAYLFTYATGRSVPADVDSSMFAEAFRPRS